jgi:LPS-assembly lipoprotein
VRPLYSDAAVRTGAIAPESASLRSVAIQPVKTRAAQEVRNQLIFLLHGGAAEPAQPAYTLTLNVESRRFDSAVVAVGNENRTTAGTMTLSAGYVLSDAQTGEAVATGRREIMSSFDRGSQEFAVMRAARDAEDRAARELAEILRLDIAQKLAARDG